MSAQNVRGPRRCTSTYGTAGGGRDLRHGRKWWPCTCASDPTVTPPRSGERIIPISHNSGVFLPLRVKEPRGDEIYGNRCRGCGLLVPKRARAEVTVPARHRQHGVPPSACGATHRHHFLLSARRIFPSIPAGPTLVARTSPRWRSERQPCACASRRTH